MKFHHVFILMLLIAGLSAFVMPKRLGDAPKGKFDGLFAPVSSPVRGLASALRSRAGGGQEETPAGSRKPPRTPAEMQSEIADLRNQVSSLTGQLDDLIKVNEDRAKLGDLRKFCEPFSVTAGDSGNRASLSILGTGGSSLGRVSAGMPVLYGHWLLGRVEYASPVAARVQLSTDTAFRVTADFSRYVENGPQAGFVKLPAPAVSLTGDGKGRLRIIQLKLEEVKEARLAEGDTVRLNDHDGWPAALQGIVLGQIESIAEHPQHQLFAEIVVKPPVDLTKLNEVMVMTKK